MNRIMALSLWQPWAALIRPEPWGKHIETRSWPTDYRGPLVIHAARRQMSEDEREVCGGQAFREAFYRIGDLYMDSETDQTGFPYPDSLPMLDYGAALAVCYLRDCVRIPSAMPYRVETAEYPDGIQIPPGYPECDFGDYTPGRFDWVLSSIRPLARPRFMRGAQGLWACDHPELIALGAEVAAAEWALKPKQMALF